MTITLELSPELEARLRAEAARRGLSLEDCAIALIEEALGMEPSVKGEPAPGD